MKLIILDRDGVINKDSLEYIKSPDEFIPFPGSLESIVRLNRAGFRVAVATNQSGLGRGLFDQETLDQIHSKLQRLLSEMGGSIDKIEFCPHTPDDGCLCRKPRTLMLEKIGNYFGSSLKGVYMIGDTEKDVLAARGAGANPVLVRTGKGEETLSNGFDATDLPVFDDLSSAVDWVLSGKEEFSD